MLRAGMYANSVFYAELAAQKAVKSVITALGYESGKSHRPTGLLKALMAGGLIRLKDEQMEDLRRLAEYVLVLEDQRATPRYG